MERVMNEERGRERERGEKLNRTHGKDGPARLKEYSTYVCVLIVYIDTYVLASSFAPLTDGSNGSGCD